MTQQQALEVKDLAKPTVEALEVIVESGEITCWKCDGSKVVQAHPHHYLTAPDKMWKCHVCNGIGKIGGWKWKPEVNQTVLYDKKLMFIVSICQTRLILLPFDIPDFGESLADYACTPEIIDVIPILEWEEIERVLERMGYTIVVDVGYYSSFKEKPHAIDLDSWNNSREYKSSRVMVSCQIYTAEPREPKARYTLVMFGKTRQEAVMRSVIALGKKLGEGIRHV